MEVKIRLQRAGSPAQKTYNYRIVAIPKATKREGKYLELLGYYDPSKTPESIKIDMPKLEKWLEKGAQMSDTINSLVKKIKKAK